MYYYKGFKKSAEIRNRLAAEYGPIYEIWLFGISSLILSGIMFFTVKLKKNKYADPELVRQMLSNRDCFNDKSGKGFSLNKVIPLSILGIYFILVHSFFLFPFYVRFFSKC